MLIASASANDLNESEVPQVNGDYELDVTDLSEKLETEEVTILQDEPKSITVSDKTFTGIKNAINSANDGDTIILDGVYTQKYTILDVDPANSNSNPTPRPHYYITFDSLNVNKKLNFVGINNAVLNGNIETPQTTITVRDYDYFVKINSEGVTFKNITFTFSKGVSALSSGYSCSIDNCTFINNKKFAIYEMNGAAIYLNNCVKTNISNTKFITNAGKDYGGAIYVTGNSEVNIMNCYFEQNSASNGGAILVQTVSQCEIINCSFNGNSASKGAAIYGGSVVDCNFNGQGSNVLYGTSNVLDCIFDTYPTVSYHYNTVLNINNSVTNVGFDDLLVANLSDVRGQLSNRILNLSIGDKKYNLTTDSNGIAEFRFGDYISEPGQYSISVNFEGDQNNYPITHDFDILLKTHSFLEVDDLSIVKGDTGKLYANLSKAGGPLSGKIIVFSINGKKVNMATGADGLVSVNVRYLDLTDFGKYSVCVSFEGDENYFPVSKNVTVCINTYEGNLTVNQNGNYYNNSLLEFNLINSRTNEPVSNASIQVVFSNGEIVTLSTDLNGRTDYPIYFDSGLYSFNASVVDLNAGVNRVEEDFVINNVVGIIEVIQNGTGYNKSNLVVKLYNPNTNQVYKNIKINIQFDTGDFSEIITNDNGIAVCPIPFIPGSYNALIYVSSPYVQVNNVEKEDIIIGKSDADVIFSNEIIFAYGGTGYTNLTVIGGIVDKISVIGYPDITPDFNNNVVSVTGLGIGHYILNVTVNPDSYHNPTYKTLNITVIKTASIVNGDDIVFDYGDSGSTTLTVIGGEVSKDNITVLDYNGANITMDNNVVSVSGLDAGNYKLQIITTPDNSHSSVTKLINITVNKIDSIVTGDDIVFDYGSFGNTNLTIVGCNVVGSNISVVGYDDAIIYLNGTIVTISNLNAGSYTLQVITTPDSNHNSIINKDIKVTVNKIDSSVDANDIVFDYGGTGSTIMRVVGCSVSENNISVINYEANINIADNKLYVSGLNAGSYKLQVTTTPNSNYKSVTRVFNITVNKVDADIGLGGDILFNLNDLGYTDVKYIIGGDVSSSTMYVVDHEEAVISYDSINKVISVSGLDEGSYILSVTVIPDSNHNSVTKNLAIKVTSSGNNYGKMDSKINNLDPIIFNYGSSGFIIVSVVGGTIESSGISIDNHPEVKPKLVGNKIIVFGLKPGSYTLRITTTPFENYYSVTETTSVTVNKVNVVCKANKTTLVPLKKGALWTVKIKDSKTGKAINGLKLTLKVFTGKKFKSVIVTTNSKGVASYQTKGLAKGTHKVIVSTNQIGYNLKPFTSSIKVIKQTALKFKVKKKTAKDGATLSITVMNKKTKKPINGVKVKLLIYTGKKYKTVTLKSMKKGKFKGVCGYGTNKLSVGKHKVKIMPAAIKYSGSAKSTMKITKKHKKAPAWETKDSAK